VLNSGRSTEGTSKLERGGGDDANIKLYGRENSSGTYVFFQENVVKGDYALNCQTLPGTAAVVNAVKKIHTPLDMVVPPMRKGLRFAR
jgi:ABC-type phosphate transport system substrate-binding protein